MIQLHYLAKMVCQREIDAHEIPARLTPNPSLNRGKVRRPCVIRVRRQTTQLSGNQAAQ